MRRAILIVALLSFAPLARADDPRAEGLRHFRIGLELVDRFAWDSALAEFMRSRDLFPTPTALKNAAVCLRELGRYDEALDMYDELLERFESTLEKADRAAVDSDMARLDRFVGTLDVKSEPPGATVVVDGRVRGTTPLVRPLRVSVGTRRLRIYKDAFAPYEARLRVASHETTRADATLLVVSKLGTLRVNAGTGFDVVVDGAVVGVTPWEGTLTTGAHTVALRNAAEEGSAPAPVEIRTSELTTIAPATGKLMGKLRVEPTPSDASVVIDGKDAGHGSWSGELPSGQHEVTVRARWYETVTQPVRIHSRSAQAVRPVLETVPRAFFEIVAGFVPLYDATARLELGACNSACFGTFVGLRGGYQLTEHVAAELFIDYLTMPRESNGLLTATTRSGEDVSVGWAEGANATAVIGGAGIRYQLFRQTPLTFRMSVGLARLQLGIASAGNYIPAGENSSHAVGHLPHVEAFWTPAALPEIRFGWRFSNGIAFDAGVGLLLMVFPSVAPATGTLEGSAIDTWPRSASFGGGFGWAIPLTASIRLEL